MSVNELPIEALVTLAGAALVVLLWLALRFGRTIAKAVLALGALAIGGIIALAVLAQGAASFQTANAAKETARVAQKAATGNLLLVGAVGCIGGVALLVILALAVLSVVLFYRWQQAERRQVQPVALPRQRQRQALPPEVIYVDDGGFDDLVAIGDLDGMAINWEDWA